MNIFEKIMMIVGFASVISMFTSLIVFSATNKENVLDFCEKAIETSLYVFIGVIVVVGIYAITTKLL